MVYDGTYTLSARVCTEAVATCLLIFTAESVLANELLSSTKGRGMGFGWVAVGFSFSFTINILCFGFISAHMNPAMLVALLVLGDLGVADFFALLAAEMLGGFVGAVLVWLHYVPHFKSIPEPPVSQPEDLLLRSRDYLPPSGLGISSYDSRHAPKGTLQQALLDIKYYLARPQVVHEITDHNALVERALGRDSQHGGHHRIRRRSVQVCDMHRRLKDLSLAQHLSSMGLDYSDALAQPSTDCSCHRLEVNAAEHAAPASTAGDMSYGDSSGAAGSNAGANATSKPTEDQKCQACMSQQLQIDRIKSSVPWFSLHKQPQQNSNKPMPRGEYPRHAEAHQHREDALYQAALIADQNAKLSIFATRPGIRSPFFNWLVEFLGTTVLIMAALLISEQGTLMYAEFKPLFQPLFALFIGYLVLVLILGLGGPTGIAMNPARDAAPRFAHWVLPISGKGPSEWRYCIIPVTAGFVGGLAAAGLFRALSCLNHSQRVEGYYHISTAFAG